MSTLSLISIGPGDLDYMLPAAMGALRRADVIIGYQIYLDQLRKLIAPHQELISSQLGQEVQRATHAIDLASQGKNVAMVSSGDIGIYAMASPIFDVLREREWSGSEPHVEVFPGVSAIQATAAQIGAPLGHDFCTISLSDLLTPWPVIQKRVKAAAWGDFVIGFYNPRSKKRDWQLGWAMDVLRDFRPGETPVVIARNVTRPDEDISVVTLADFDPTVVDMFTLVLVGNSQSYVLADKVATPRGYTEKGQPRVTDGASTQGEHDILSYPVSLTQLTGKMATVIGGGPVATRKVRGLLSVGANVMVVSPDLTDTLQSLLDEGHITWLSRKYETQDIDGATIVFAATNERDVNREIGEVCNRHNILCSVADAPKEGSFHSMAVHRGEDVVLAVGTQGETPGKAKQVRNQLRWLLDQ